MILGCEPLLTETCKMLLEAEQSSLYTRRDTRLALQWRHIERDGVSKHQHHDCLFNRLFRHSSKKTSKLRVTGLCTGNSPVTGESPPPPPPPPPPNHQRPVRRKRFPFDDVIMSARETDVLSDPCPAGFTYLTTGYRCYYYDYRRQLTWMEAVRFCESRGGLLLALATTDKFDRFIAWYRKSECCWRFSLILTNPFSRCVSVRHKLLIIICELYHECIND